MRPFTFAALLLLGPSLAAQSPAPLKFEVASVKLDEKQDRGGRRSTEEISLPFVRVLPGGRVDSWGHTVQTLISWAYGITNMHQRVEGNQDFLLTEVEISAKAAADSITTDEAKAMMRALLEERFQMRWRWQPREADGFLLTPSRDDGRPGSGLRAFTGDCAARATNVVRFDSPDYDEKARCTWVGVNGRQRAIGVSMAAVAERLTLLMAAPVSDRTGWPGLFSFSVVGETLDMPSNALLAGRTASLGAAVRTDAPYLLEVFRNELGLKLVKNRATVQDFVVEAFQPLIEN